MNDDRWGRFLGCLLRAGIVTFLCLVACFDLLIAATKPGVTHTVIVGCSALCILAVAMRRPAPTTRMVVVGVASLSCTAVAAVFPAGRAEWGMVETVAIPLLIVTAVRRFDQRRAVAVTVLLGAAEVALPSRGEVPTAGMMLGLLVAVAVGVGAYLRALDSRRVRAVARVRQAERLELARDLHDFVAHHVTGIVVQAQAARYVSRTGPGQVGEMLGGIEDAAVQALASMRRLVEVLREDGSPATRPAGDLAQLADLAAEHGRNGRPVLVDVDPRLRAARLPPEVVTSIHRVAQEALTNAAKHAADATAVRIAVHDRSGGVEVAVRDDGDGGAPRLPGVHLPAAARGGGFGLLGLSERVEAIGGRFHAGRRAEGGFEVVAWLPLAESPR